jgi:hypothetical protein
LAARCGLRLSRWKLRQLMRALRYRFTRPRHAPRRADPERDEIHQAIGRRIAEVRGSRAIVVEDETDIRLFPVLRRISRQPRGEALVASEGFGVGESLLSGDGGTARGGRLLLRAVDAGEGLPTRGLKMAPNFSNAT